MKRIIAVTIICMALTCYGIVMALCETEPSKEAIEIIKENASASEFTDVCESNVITTLPEWRIEEIIASEKPHVPVEEKEPETNESKIEYTSLGCYAVTAYCPCKKCCGKYALNRPLDKDGNPIVYTASGELAKAGVTIAADTSVLPFGTEIIIDGHTYTVQDTGGFSGKTVDIYFRTHEEACAWGKQWHEVLVKHG